MKHNEKVSYVSKFHIFFILFCIVSKIGARIQPPLLTPTEIKNIGTKIWCNESNNSIEKLTWWSPTEDFPSFGIGHFIWYPQNEKSRIFTQTFPALISFFKKHNVQLPRWLATCISCPWNSRDQFYQTFSEQKLLELRTLLSQTITLQTKFIIERFYTEINSMLKTVSRKRRKVTQHHIYDIASQPNGLYALIDYVNFKGIGTNPKERYNNLGWGLLQVLENMQPYDTPAQTLNTFSVSAQQMLTRRVENAPQKSVEQRYLPGWITRIKTYTKS